MRTPSPPSVALCRAPLLAGIIPRLEHEYHYRVITEMVDNRRQWWLTGASVVMSDLDPIAGSNWAKGHST